MGMFDALGPLARDAINNAPRNPDIRVFVQAFKNERDRDRVHRLMQLEEVPHAPPIDWCDQATDAELADFINRKIASSMGKGIAWHQLKPRRSLRPQATPIPGRLIRSSAGRSSA